MLVTTPAIVLHAFPYGDTSKIARLATRDHGVQSVIAKGAMRPRNPFGACLQTLSAGTARFHFRPHRELHTLAGFDVGDQHASLAGDLARYSAAAALAELVLRFAEAEPQPDVFDVLAHGLDALTHAESGQVPYVALAALWLEVSVLGFSPQVDSCVRCGGALGPQAQFSLPEGGLLCLRCGGGGAHGALDRADQAALAAFATGAADGAAIPARHLAAHRRLLARFVRRHVADERELPALAFWEAGRTAKSERPTGNSQQGTGNAEP
jgi:DNA repair protein RecO (recombination protein O)